MCVLVACSSDDKAVEKPRPTSAPELNSAKTFEGALVKAGKTSVSQFIKNGIYSATDDHSYYYRLETALPTAPAPTADTASSTFSTTNTQELGVDEADRVKYNGDVLYLAANSQWRNDVQEPAHVRVLERQSDFSLAEVAALPLAKEHGNIDGIYQANNSLAILSNNAQMYSLMRFVPEPWISTENKLTLELYDTSVPSSPTVKSQIKIDGTMLSNRRIGDQLYIVTGYTATVDGLNPFAETEKEQLENYLTILDTPDSELMPKIYFDDGEGEALNQIDECVIPASATDKDGYAHLLTIIRINMTDVSDRSASCISSVAESMYMSLDNLYLTSSVDNSTVIHKVSLDANLTYQATGKVDGIIGWRSSPNLRMSENNDMFRIVSSDYSAENVVHKLSVLEQNGNQLSVIGSVPNEANPEAIGKPGEDIYAVRFFQDKAYIVTFERIDPLYVLDLSIAAEPKILGALEIPGFSSYLHPLDNGYLLGIGQQVNARNTLEDAIEPVEPISSGGMKVSLFDVTDPSNPLEVGNMVKPDSYTPVEYDYHALTVLNTAGNYQFALPVERSVTVESEEGKIWTSENSLVLLEIDTTATQPELIERSVLKVTTEGYFYGGNDRSIIHDENIYYIHGNQVWRSTWEEEGEVFGPY